MRSVYLIPEGTYKEHLQKGIHYFHKNYVELFPELEGYVTRLKNWKDIQLMIPTAFYADKYVDGRLAILGDAAHTVHPMAGEGMNMAIQDADVLGNCLQRCMRAEEFRRTSLNGMKKSGSHALKT